MNIILTNLNIVVCDSQTHDGAVKTSSSLRNYVSAQNPKVEFLHKNRRSQTDELNETEPAIQFEIKPLFGDQKLPFANVTFSIYSNENNKM